MGDNYYGFAVLLHFAQNCEQLLCFLRGENGGRLIENKDIRASVKHFDYFNRLLFGNGHFIDFL